MESNERLHQKMLPPALELSPPNIYVLDPFIKKWNEAFEAIPVVELRTEIISDDVQSSEQSTPVISAAGFAEYWFTQLYLNNRLDNEDERNHPINQAANEIERILEDLEDKSLLINRRTRIASDLIHKADQFLRAANSPHIRPIRVADMRVQISFDFYNAFCLRLAI